VSDPWKFDGYTLRDATEADEPLARVWTQHDEHHHDMDGRFWLEKDKGVETYVCEENGHPLFFVRLDKAVRIRIQFPPNVYPPGSDEDHKHRDQVRRGLMRGMNFLEIALSVKGFRELIFDSVSPLLRAFTIGRLRFAKKPDTLSRMLPSFTLPKRAERMTLHAENNAPCADPTKHK
jgi:hypothetical protein